jgi:hypothetical protein
MAATTFTDGVTLIVSAWLNDVDSATYDNFGDGTSYTGRLTIADATDATSTVTGSAKTAGGLGVAKALWVGGLANIAGNVTLQGDLAVNGGDLTSSATTFNLLNATVTTLNIGAGASTAMNVGNAGGTNTILGGTSFNQTVTVSGNFTAGGQLGGQSTVAKSSIRSNHNAQYGLEVSTSADVADGIFVAFYNSSDGQQGAIKATNPTTTAFATSSDKRLKKVFGPASEEKAILRLMQYEIMNFEWLHTPGRMYVGGMAQQIHSVNPDIGHLGGDDPNKNPAWIDKAEYVNDLVLVCQNQEKRVAELERLLAQK